MSDENIISKILEKPDGGVYRFLLACLQCGKVYGDDDKIKLCRECRGKEYRQLEFDFGK